MTVVKLRRAKIANMVCSYFLHSLWCLEQFRSTRSGALLLWYRSSVGRVRPDIEGHMEKVNAEQSRAKRSGGEMKGALSLLCKSLHTWTQCPEVFHKIKGLKEPEERGRPSQVNSDSQLPTEVWWCWMGWGATPARFITTGFVKHFWLAELFICELLRTCRGGVRPRLHGGAQIQRLKAHL